MNHIKILSFNRDKSTISLIERGTTNGVQNSRDIFVDNIPDDFGTIEKPLRYWYLLNGKLTLDTELFQGKREYELREELKIIENEKLKMIDLLKAELLIKFGEHFKKNVGKGMASSHFDLFEKEGGAENGSLIGIRINHYGIENYYGKEIADLYKEIMEMEKK